MKNKAQGTLVLLVIATVVVLIVGVIVGRNPVGLPNVENAQTFTQSLTSTIGDV